MLQCLRLRHGAEGRGRSIGIMIETLVKGIIIGIIISAPLGPVGALCLRETIYSGRQEGLLTGLGAMLSDVLYGCLVFLGVELVWDCVLPRGIG